MKTNTPLNACLALALFTASGLQADEPSPEITGLQKAAADFVTAFNAKNAAAIAALFTENGEITDLNCNEITSGRAAIQARYAEVFAAKDASSVAVEVDCLPGTYGLNDQGLLVLTTEDSQMISSVTMPTDKQMKFVLVGAPDGDPGLDFNKS